VLHGVGRRSKTIIAVLGAAVLTAAVALVIASNTGNGQPALQVSVNDTGLPNGKSDAAPGDFNELARSVYEGQREYCRQRWSTLLFAAGEPQSTPFSRSALRETAAKLPPAKRFNDELLNNIATAGCVAGFVELLKEDRTYALS
jgi:hypothetical protein